MDHWVNVMGVGPWYYIDKVKTDYFRHRGQDSAMEMSVALANSGDLQIELIQQRNDAPSMYKEFLDSGREGLQHMSYWTRDYQALYDRACRLAIKWDMKARSAAKRAASPISIRKPIPAPLSKYPTSAAAREVSSSTSARSRPLGTAPTRPRSRRTLSDARYRLERRRSRSEGHSAAVTRTGRGAGQGAGGLAQPRRSRGRRRAIATARSAAPAPSSGWNAPARSRRSAATSRTSSRAIA